MIAESPTDFTVTNPGPRSRRSSRPDSAVPSDAVSRMLDRIDSSGLDDAAKQDAVGDLLDRLHEGLDEGGLPLRNRDGAETQDWVDFLEGGEGLGDL